MPVVEPLAVAWDVSIEFAPAIENDLVVMRRAIRLPNGMGRVVYVGPVDVVRLLAKTSFGRPAESIVTDWSTTMPAEVGWSLIRWLWDRGVLVKASDRNVAVPSQLGNALFVSSRDR